MELLLRNSSRSQSEILFLIVLPVIGLSVAQTAVGQPSGGFELPWSTVDGGGASFITAGGFEVGTTVGQPDAVEMPAPGFTLNGGFWPGILVDCNANTVHDLIDIANGTSQDVNGDGIPDECALGACCEPCAACTVTDEATCNASGGRYVGNLSVCLGDANGNGVDDVCEPETIDVTSGTAGTVMAGQSFNETRGVDVTVLRKPGLNVTSMTLHGLSIGGAASADVRARIYDSGMGTVVASGDVTVTAGGSITVPIVATLSWGASYRLAFYVETTPLWTGSAEVFDPDPSGVGGFPYTDSSGLLRLNSAHSSAGLGFPSNPNNAVPMIEVRLGDLTQLVTVDLVPGGRDGASTTAAAMLDALMGPTGSGVVTLNSFAGADIAGGIFCGGIGGLGSPGPIGIKQGLVLSTGDIFDVRGGAPGESNTSDFTTTVNFQAGHTGLTDLIPQNSTFDAASLRFTINGSGVFACEFVFASECYGEWVNTGYNDVFGLFVDGKNQAVIPAGCGGLSGWPPAPVAPPSATVAVHRFGGGTPVSVNTINGGNPLGVQATNSACFADNDCSNAGGFPCAPNPGRETEADGLTMNPNFPGTPLVLRSRPVSLTPNQHQVELAIADTGDSVVNSNVFIRCTLGGGRYEVHLGPRGGRETCACYDVLCNPDDPGCPEDVPPGGTFEVGTCDEIVPPCEPRGACCLTYDTCAEMTEDVCLAIDGTYNGDDTTCGPEVGACDVSPTLCVETTPDCCTGAYHGDTTTCPPVGACCSGDGSCEVVAQPDCAGTFLGPNILCDGDNDFDEIDDRCQLPGACEFPQGCLDNFTRARCELSGVGVYLGDGTTCPLDCNGNGIDDAIDIASGTSEDLNANGVPDECEPQGTCCLPDGNCVDALDQASCEIGLGGTYLGAGTNCAGDANGDGISDGCALGACCDPDTGDCADTHEWECRRCATTSSQCSTDADCWPDESCTSVNWHGPRTPDDFENPVCHGGTFDTGFPCGHSFDCDGGAGECYSGERCILDAPCDAGACCGVDGTCSEVDGPGNCLDRHCAKDPTLLCSNDLDCIIGPTDLGPCEDRFLGFGSECNPNCCPQPLDTGGDCCADIYECDVTGQSCNPIDSGVCNSGADGTCTLVCAGPILFDIPVPPVIPPGQSVTFDITSDSTSASSTAADVCASGSDPAWYHSFAVDDCAVVTWTFCCNEPWIPAVSPTLISNCPCDGGINMVDPNPGRSGFGDACGNDYCCADGNYSVEWTVRAGTYAYQIPAGKACDGTAQGCVTDTDCLPGVQCVDLSRAYQAHLTVEPCIPAACCHAEACSFLNKFECEGTGGVFLGDLTPNPIAECVFAPCGLGVCCLPGGGCEPAAGGQLTVPECDALGGVYQGGVICADDSCPICYTDADCDDGLFCNGPEWCDPVNGCQGGTPVDCDDGVNCTVDSCDDTTDSCDSIPDDGACDNGLYCDGPETCDPVLGCQAGTAIDCDDGVDCTDDSCNEATDSCDTMPNDAACDNGLFCDGVETCDSLSDCQLGTDPCPGLSCDEETDRCEEAPLERVALPANATHAARKHRYLSIDATTNLPNAVSIKVEIAEMNRCQNDLRRSCIDDEDCPTVCAAEPDLHSCGDGSICPDGVCIETGPCGPHPDVGLSWYVQEPQTRGADCPNGICDEEDYYARLGPDPLLSDWKDECEDAGHIPDWTGGCATLHIGDCEIVPGVKYNVYACLDTGECSDPLEVETTRRPDGLVHYGDVAGGVLEKDPPGSRDFYFDTPDDFTNVKDVSAYLLTVGNWGTTNLPHAHPTWIDLHGPGAGIPPQYILMVTDLTMILRAWVDSWPYENSIGGLAPGDCP